MRDKKENKLGINNGKKSTPFQNQGKGKQKKEKEIKQGRRWETNL